MENLVEITDASRATVVRLTIGNHTEDTTPIGAVERAGALYQLHGAFPAFRYFAPASPADVAPVAVQAPPAPVSSISSVAPVSDDDPPSDRPSAPTGAALGYSNFGAGNQIMDAAARSRMERVYDRLEKAGVKGIERDKTIAGYAPGTRMAQIGYVNQEKRRAEFLALRPAEQVCADLTARVQSEGRADVEIGSYEFADALAANGKIRFRDLRIGEQAIRGLFLRTDAPGLSYALALRERIAANYTRGADVTPAVHADVAQLATLIRYEVKRAPEVALKLRTRANPGDVYAVTSPGYANADAPEALREIVPQLPKDARATCSYDPRTTAWTIRLDVWTPTAVADQAVGEPFQAFASIGSRDNGTGAMTGGGGIVILACLNAGTYVADGSSVNRRHRGSILVDVAAMMRGALASIDALCDAWGKAREATIAVPERVTIEQAIPGFWRSLLTDRSSELVTVLPGRTETHVQNLTAAYYGERRDESRIVRADLAQGWTRYAQSFTADVQRDAERAIGAWTVNGRAPGYKAAKGSAGE